MIRLPLNETTHQLKFEPLFNGSPFQSDGVTPAAFDGAVPVEWTVADASIATIDASGIVTLLAAATFLVDPADAAQEISLAAITAKADGDLTTGSAPVVVSETVVFSRAVVIVPIIGANGGQIVAA